MDKKRDEKMKKRQTHKRRFMKGGSGILTYGLNLYNPDTQLEDNYYTSRQMYSNQTVMNPRVLGGGKRKTKKEGTRKRDMKKGGKKSKRGSRKEKKENCP